MRSWKTTVLLTLCVGSLVAPVIAASREPKPPYKGLTRQAAWEQNERWYEEETAPIQAKLRKNGDDYKARRISEAQYRKRAAELEEQLGDLLRRKEENSQRIVRHFNRVPEQPRQRATGEPAPPYKGLTRQQAWEQNERWYEEALAPIQAKLRKVGDDYKARRISEEQYREQSSKLQEQMGDLLRRKEENSARIARYFQDLRAK